MDNNIFRKKSIDRISSPESLTNYIKVANPSVWLVLVAIMMMLIGLLLWASIDDISDNFSFYILSDGQKCVCYLPENDENLLIGNETINIEGAEYALGTVASMPEKMDKEDSDEAYILHLMDNDSDKELWVYKIEVKAELPEGIYTGYLNGKSIKPISYITN